MNLTAHFHLVRDLKTSGGLAPFVPSLLHSVHRDKFNFTFEKLDLFSYSHQMGKRDPNKSGSV